MAAREVPDKLIFGSDGPEGDSRVEIYKIRLLKLSKDVERKVLGGTVRSLVPV
jgi:predicted TIM-barrel fold metal-dependent hydrolase